MLCNVRYRLNAPSPEKLEQAESVVQQFVNSSRGRLEIAVHEAGHKQVADQLGLKTYYTGPSINQESSDFDITLGGVHFLSSETGKLTTQELARLLVAGRVAENVLLGNCPLASDGDFEFFIYSGQAKPSDLILVWKQTEEQMLKTLSASIADQRKVIYEAQRYEQTIWPELGIQKVNPRPPVLETASTTHI